MSRRSRNEADIKAPDGFLLGGLRKVRRDGTVLFARDWWICPPEWIGEEIWVHYATRDGCIEAWPPGVEIWHDGSVYLQGTDRMSAKPAYRNSFHKAWSARTGAAPHDAVTEEPRP